MTNLKDMHNKNMEKADLCNRFEVDFNLFEKDDTLYEVLQNMEMIENDLHTQHLNQLEARRYNMEKYEIRERALAKLSQKEKEALDL